MYLVTFQGPTLRSFWWQVIFILPYKKLPTLWIVDKDAVCKVRLESSLFSCISPLLLQGWYSSSALPCSHSILKNKTKKKMLTYPLLSRYSRFILTFLLPILVSSWVGHRRYNKVINILLVELKKILWLAHGGDFFLNVNILLLKLWKLWQTTILCHPG